MDLVLYYRGPLKSNGDAKEKHAIREKFHEQLKQLWTLSPFDQKYKPAIDTIPRVLPSTVSPDLQGYFKAVAFPSIVMQVGPCLFLPLVNAKLNAVAEISITLLRPEPSGRVITTGGDLDNRIKTLLDALQVPDENQAKNLNITDQPFHCLLENDKLITKLSVEAEHLLEPVKSPKRSDPPVERDNTADRGNTI